MPPARTARRRRPTRSPKSETLWFAHIGEPDADPSPKWGMHKALHIGGVDLVPRVGGADRQQASVGAPAHGRDAGRQIIKARRDHQSSQKRLSISRGRTRPNQTHKAKTTAKAAPYATYCISPTPVPCGTLGKEREGCQFDAKFWRRTFPKHPERFRSPPVVGNVAQLQIPDRICESFRTSVSRGSEWKRSGR